MFRGDLYGAFIVGVAVSSPQTIFYLEKRIGLH